jgi:phosphoenolpyruvate carboxykinase (GTP)
VFNPMSNIDFLSIPIGRYIQNTIEFGKRCTPPPRIFSVNYFLKDKNGEWVNHKNDKAIWLKWMDLRVHDEVHVLKTPTGFIPLYEDVQRLFRTVLQKRYSKEDYIKQFTVRIPGNLAKIARMNEIFRERVKDTPAVLFTVLDEQQERLLAAQQQYGDYISPFDLL